MKIKVFSKQKAIIYSTDPAIVGRVDHDNSRLENALRGRVDAELETKNKIVDLSEEARIDGYVRSYLKENGYKVMPQREFKQHWNNGVRAFGDPVDPTTGKVNMKTFSQIMVSVRDRMSEETALDAFVFTDLVELEVSFSAGLKHIARWDGVSRKPSLQGPGSGVSTDFDWNMQAAVASLQVSIYDMELQRVFVSRGGMDATDAIDTRSSSGRYVRRRNILENEDNVKEGIALALHPFIVMEDWPGEP